VCDCMRVNEGQRRSLVSIRLSGYSGAGSAEQNVHRRKAKCHKLGDIEINRV
jgi:hypothetical protein